MSVEAGGFRSTLGRVRDKLDPEMSGWRWPILGRVWSTAVDVGLSLVQFVPSLAEFAPNLVESGPSLANSGQTSVEFGRSHDKCWSILPGAESGVEVGRLRRNTTGFGPVSANSESGSVIFAIGFGSTSKESARIPRIRTTLVAER